MVEFVRSEPETGPAEFMAGQILKILKEAEELEARVGDEEHGKEGPHNEDEADREEEVGNEDTEDDDGGSDRPTDNADALGEPEQPAPTGTAGATTGSPADSSISRRQYRQSLEDLMNVNIMPNTGDDIPSPHTGPEDRPEPAVSEGQVAGQGRRPQSPPLDRGMSGGTHR